MLRSFWQLKLLLPLLPAAGPALWPTLLLALLLALPQVMAAQAPPALLPPPPPAKGSRVELLPGTERLEGGRFNGEEIRKLIGNVRFKQDEMLLYCDSAYQYAAPSNRIEAFANVRMVQADTVTITGDHLTYDGDARQARMVGKPVTMRDPRMTLTTDALDYDLNRRVASYATGGHLQDPQNQLDSRRGSYDTQAKVFSFSQQVVLRNPDYTVKSDTMRYNTLTKVVTFLGPTTMRGQRGDLFARRGTYNTATKQADFRGSASVESPTYRLSGDQLVYNEVTQIGVATGNVRLLAKRDSLTIRGAYGRTNRLLGVTRVSGSPVLESVSNRGRDTLLMAADTLIATESRVDSVPGYLYAYRGVRIWSRQLQGSCDSLAYNLRDSVMYLLRQPILWANKSQLVADSMRLYMKRGKLDRLVMRLNSFVISQDTLRNFNQVSGRHMVALFGQNELRRVTVEGNGESLYYALEGDSVVTGVNKVVCAAMRLAFRDRKLGTISFLTQPDAAFIPPHELQPEAERLKGFAWRPQEQPTRAVVLARRAPLAAPAPTVRKKGKTKAPKAPKKPKVRRQATR